MKTNALFDLLSIPTAPFREHLVAAHIDKYLAERGVPLFRDACGNLIVGAANEAQYRRKLRASTVREPLRVFVAHMDHPGFHGEEWLAERRLSARWFGGSPTKALIGSGVWVSDFDGDTRRGCVRKAELHKGGRWIERLEVEIEDFAFRGTSPKKLFGGFGFSRPVWRKGDIVYTKAADDLIGVYAIMQLAVDLYATRSPSRDRFIGLLTRAEEVGFIGAIGHFEAGWMSEAAHPPVIISLEASRTLPGAEIGKGPVVRLGDRGTLFDAGAMRLFSDLAEKKFHGRHQRRIMDGGSCEAYAATAAGLRAMGMSVPLGNYHNQNLEGGPESARTKLGPAPEFVHLDDIEVEIKLCHALMEKGLPWQDPWRARWESLRKSFREKRGLLKQEKPRAR